VSGAGDSSVEAPQQTTSPKKPIPSTKRSAEAEQDQDPADPSSSSLISERPCRRKSVSVRFGIDDVSLNDIIW
jgi:hypothetical protein